MPQKLLSVEEAGRRLKVSRATVYRMIKRGALPSVRERGRRRVPESAVAGNRRFVHTSLDHLPPFTLDNPIFKMAGAYRSGGQGAGASDKYAILGTPHWR